VKRLLEHGASTDLMDFGGLNARAHNDQAGERLDIKLNHHEQVTREHSHPT
jgi:hypothetical protein